MCQSYELESLLRKQNSIQTAIFRMDYDSINQETFEISNAPYVLEIKDAIKVSLVEFKFSKGLIPAENGFGPDSRKLSARADIKCGK